MPFKQLFLSLLLTFLVSTRLRADDWPQWRGPNRDGKSVETGLLETWPTSGPKQVWTAKGLGSAYSAVSISDGRIFTMGNIGKDEFVIALSEKDGSILWKQRTTSAYRNNRGSGPRGTPTVDGKRVYALGAGGEIVCLEAADGKVVWQANIIERFGSENIRWGLSESVLIDGNNVICSPGGEDSCVVALSKKDGKTVWQSKGLHDRAGYASAIAITVGGVRQIVHYTHRSTAGIRASDGELLWRYERASNGIANCATPVFFDDRIFVSSDYGQGCASLALASSAGKTAMKEVFFHKEMQNHHGGIIFHEGYLYAHSGGNSARTHKFVCLEAKTGEVKWSDKGPGKASIVFADGHFYCLSENGVASLMKASPAGYVEKGSFVFKSYKKFKTGNIGEDDEKPTWAHPVVANGRLYLRDQDRLVAYDIKK